MRSIFENVLSRNEDNPTRRGSASLRVQVSRPAIPLVSYGKAVGGPRMMNGRMAVLRFALPGLSALALCTPISIGEVSAQSILVGTVRDDSTHQAVSGAEVVIEALRIRSLSNQEGRYFLQDIPSGRQLLLVRAVGYHPTRIVVLATSEGTVRTDVQLVPAAVRLDPIEVIGQRARQARGIGLEGFEERRRLRFGMFIDSTVLRQSEHLDLTTVLRRAGVEVRGSAVVGRRGCPAQVFLDGIVLRDPGAINLFSTFGLAAVEVYPSAGQVPAEYQKLDQGCGVLLLWTRKGP